MPSTPSFALHWKPALSVGKPRFWAYFSRGQVNEFIVTRPMVEKWSDGSRRHGRQSYRSISFLREQIPDGGTITR